MEIEEEDRNGVSIIAPKGRLDINTSPVAEAALLPKFDSVKGIVVDFSALTYISSAGLRVLLMAAKRSKASGVPLALANLAPPILEVFEVSGFAKLFTIVDSREAAVASVAGS